MKRNETKINNRKITFQWNFSIRAYTSMNALQWCVRASIEEECMLAVLKVLDEHGVPADADLQDIINRTR